MVVDRERVGHCFEEKGRIEASFYFLHAVSESHLGLMNGLVGVVSCERLHLQKNLAKPLPKRSFELFRSEAIPVKCRAGHLVAVEAKPESLPGKLFHQSLNFLASYFNKFDHLKTRLRFHRVESVDDAVCSLGDYGLSRQHLPKRCGGSADLPSLYQERLEREKEFYASLQNDDLSSQVPDGATKSKEKAHSSTDKKEESTNDIFSEPIANNASAGALSKQQHEELLELSQEFALKRQLAELKREREIALPQQRLMEAKVNVCSAMKDQYDSDLRLLHVYLSFVFISLVPPNSDFVDYFLKHGFVFMGRNLFTGRFMFREALVVWPAFFVPTFMSIRQELPYLTPTQLRKLVASASRIAKRVIQKAESTQNATLSPADRDMRDRLQTILTEHAVSIQQVMSTMPETSLPASTIDSKDEEEEDRELQSELSALQDQVASLQERNGVLKEDRDILEPCTVYATEISQTYDLDKKQHLDILAQEITSMARTAFNGRYSNDTWRYDHQSLEDFLPECYRPKVVAERLFHRLYWSDSVTGIGQPTAPNPSILGRTPAKICPSQVDRVLLAHLLVMDGFMLPMDLFHVLPFSDAARLVGMPPPAATHGAHSPPDDTTTTIAPAPEEPTGKKKRPSPPEATAQERQQMVHKRRKPNLKRL
uniref:Uncharacterized protein n=1 Tax=Entomoneis paludosa TaxID=265537 RepID=A0A7S3DVA2_9STRA|mmetsp:Transcript_40133/g.83580  ORF Transcript_40133/g.83580 Transcript_40133/m.83580 type:complete len:653 (+) Transcript_40133:923-2881(+)